MSKKTINDSFYGEITYKEGYWSVKNGLNFKIIDREMNVKVEIDICNTMYEKFNMGLLSEELMKFHRENPQLLRSEEAEKVKKQQKELFKNYLIDNMDKTVHNIEEAALEKRQEMLEGQTEESFSRIVGKEKAKRVFAAKTREEKLDSLELKRLRIMIDTIEITCTCDWFEPSGGSTIFPDGSVEMFFVDSMSI